MRTISVETIGKCLLPQLNKDQIPKRANNPAHPPYSRTQRNWYLQSDGGQKHPSLQPVPEREAVVSNADVL